jgi:hypothetical protein
LDELAGLRVALGGQHISWLKNFYEVGALVKLLEFLEILEIDEPYVCLFFPIPFNHAD